MSKKANAKKTAAVEIAEKVLAAVGKTAFTVPDAESDKELEEFRARFDEADMDAVMVVEQSVLESIRKRLGGVTVGMIEHRITVIL